MSDNTEKVDTIDAKDAFEKLRALSGGRVKYLENGSTEITLKDGRIAVIKPGKWKHGKEASRISAGSSDEGSYQDALMSLLVTIDGQGIVMEDVPELPLADGMLLNAEFAKLNFS